VPEKVLVVDVSKGEVREEKRDIALPPKPTAPSDSASNDHALMAALDRASTLDELKQALLQIMARLGVRGP